MPEVILGYIGYMIEEICRANRTLILKRTKKQDVSKKLQFCYNFVKTFLRGCFIIERY